MYAVRELSFRVTADAVPLIESPLGNGVGSRAAEGIEVDVGLGVGVETCVIVACAAGNGDVAVGCPAAITVTMSVGVVMAGTFS